MSGPRKPHVLAEIRKRLSGRVMHTNLQGIGIIRYVYSGLDEGMTSDAVVVGVLGRIRRIRYLPGVNPAKPDDDSRAPRGSDTIARLLSAAPAIPMIPPSNTEPTPYLCLSRPLPPSSHPSPSISCGLNSTTLY